MVLTNLTKITTAKLQRIQAALLDEFSKYPLSTAQVARIAKHAGISRSAFYTYFENLIDAYQYLYHQALADIHQPLPVASLTSDYQPQVYLQTVTEFTEKTVNCRYYNLIKMHLLYNEAFLPKATPPALTLDSRHWAAMTLVHATIQDILLQPTKRQDYLRRLELALNKFN